MRKLSEAVFRRTCSEIRELCNPAFTVQPSRSLYIMSRSFPLSASMRNRRWTQSVRDAFPRKAWERGDRGHRGASTHKRFSSFPRFTWECRSDALRPLPPSLWNTRIPTCLSQTIPGGQGNFHKAVCPFSTGWRIEKRTVHPFALFRQVLPLCVERNLQRCADFERLKYGPT